MKKKLTAVALVVCMLAIMLVGASLAYFTDKDDAKNEFTVGNVKIDLTEPSWLADGEEADNVYPGEALPKDPTVENIGNNPCLVRISVTGLDCLGDDMLITYETQWVEGALGENWVDGEDGYFYYTLPLQPEEKTSKLFEQIRIPYELTNDKGEEWTDKLAVNVVAEAVQAQGVFASFSKLNDGIDTETVDAATGKTELQVVQEFFTKAFTPAEDQ